MMGRDKGAGLALVSLGGSYAVYSAMTLPVGTLRQMGPGMFPVSLGVILAGLGVAVFAPALLRDRPLPIVPWRSLGFALGAVVAFAIMISRFGLAPTVFVSTLIAALAIRGSGPRLVLLLAVLMVPVTWLVFVILLKIDIPLLRWNV